MFVPSANANGNQVFSYTVSDGSLSDDGDVTIAITAVNDAPVANVQVLSTAEDTPLNITLSGTDPEGSSLSYIVVTGTSHGTLLGTAPNLVYTPAANFNGTDTFTFKVNDGSLDSPVVTLTITVTPANDAPLAVDDIINGTRNAQTSFNVLANDSDIDSTSLTITQIEEATSPSPTITVISGFPTSITLEHGTLLITAANQFYFSPNTGFVGTQTFKYTVSDGSLTDEGLVTINIASGNTVPVVANESYVMLEDGTLTTTDATGTVTLANTNDNGVLANDTDADGDLLTAVLLVGPANGTVTLLADGRFTYVPNANFNGIDAFSYRVLDNRGGAATGVASITINNTNDAPTVNAATFSLAENSVGGTSIGTVVATDIDAGSVLTYSLSGSTPAETAAINSLFEIDSAGALKVKTGVTAGQLNFETKPSYAITVTATDNGSPALQGSAQVTVNLTDVAEAGPRVTSVRVNSTAWTTRFRNFVNGASFDGTTYGYEDSDRCEPVVRTALDQPQPSSSAVQC